MYPGPIGAILNPLMKGVGTDAQVDSLPYASSLCGACFEVCPVMIDIPSVLLDLRAQVVDAHRGRRPTFEEVATRLAAWSLRGSRRWAVARRVVTAGARVASTRRPCPEAPSGPRRVDAVARRSRPRADPLPALVAQAWERLVTDDRGAILGDVRRALGEARPAPSPVPRFYRAVAAPGDPVGLFADRLEDYGVVVTRTTARGVGAAIAGIVKGMSVVVPEGLGWNVPGSTVDDGLSHDALDALTRSSRRRPSRSRRRARSFSTTARSGPARAEPRARRPRVRGRADQIVADVPEAVARLDPSDL